MYRSPIEITYGQMQMQIDNDIVRAVQSYNVNVDREELIRALQYDRNQYEKGYMDGKAAAMDELVRCKDCVHCMDRKKYLRCVRFGFSNGHEVRPDVFCSFGERRSDG